MRKYAAIIVALLIVGLLAGCSKSKPAGQAVTPPSKQQPVGQAVTPPTSKKPGPSGTLGMLAGLTQKRAAIKSYVQVMNMDGQQVRHVMKLDNGRPVAMKMEMPGGRWVIVLLKEKVQYMYDPNSKIAMKVSMAGKQPPVPQSANLEDLQAPKVSSDVVDGVECWKITSVSLGDANSTVWMDKEYGLTRQMESGGKTSKMQYEQINSVPDSEFQIPPGTKVQDMASMMPKMPQMPQGMPQGMPKGMPSGMPRPPGH